MKSLWDKRVPDSIFGFVIGGYYAAVEMAFDKITGGPMNPARVFGPALFSLKFVKVHVFAAYMLAPILGKVLRVIVGRLLSWRIVLQSREYG